MEEKMNIYLANLVSFYHKLQSYHWYVQGRSFFQSHAKLEEFYNAVNAQIDELAELMLMSGRKPVSTMKGFAALATVSDAPGDFSKDMSAVFGDVLKDFEAMRRSAEEIRAEADKTGDNLVSVKMDDFIEGYAKTIWMLKSMLA